MAVYIVKIDDYDLRNIYDPEDTIRRGLRKYVSIDANVMELVKPGTPDD